MRFQALFGGLCIVTVIAFGCGDDDTGGPSGSGGASGTSGSGGASGASGNGGTSGAAGSGGTGGSTSDETFGQIYEGGEFHLGPVDYEETDWHNACAPLTKYAPAVRAAQGELLAGLWNGIPDVADYCDACIEVTTAMGKTAVLRVVTYGDTSNNSIDVSPAAYEILNSGEYPRHMSWQLAKCPETGAVFYEFQTGSSQWWTSLWVRNARLPLEKVEVQSANHASFVELERGSDGTLTDGAGFGAGEFTIRLTAIDGSQITDSFVCPPENGIAGQTMRGQGNF